MKVVFKIAETITAENEPTSLVFAGLKNEGCKETNPRKGTETISLVLMLQNSFFMGKETNPRKGTETTLYKIRFRGTFRLGKETNPRKGTETKKPLGAFLFYL